MLEAIRLEEPDRVPLFFTITPQVAARLSPQLGIADYTLADSPLSQNRISYHQLLLPLGNDVVGIGACSRGALQPGSWKRAWSPMNGR